MGLADDRGGERPSLSRRAVFGGVMAVSATALSGCAALTPRNGIAEASLQRRAVVAGLPGVRVWGDEVPADLRTALRTNFAGSARAEPATVAGPDGLPIVNVLALSSGGTNGAFGAGLLAGWTAHGTRPEFQIVTGVSAGALIAPFAFLGPRYDTTLKRVWTQNNLADLVVFQGISGILSGIAAVDTKPLADAIAKYLTPRLLHEIAREYGRGRYLLMGTTNLDAQRPVVWNMGAIAASGHPDALDLFRKIVLASAAIPGLFPPVSITVEVDGKVYEEMHVDGGTTRDVFVAPFQVSFAAYDQFYRVKPQRRIYIVSNGKITPEAQVVEAQTLPIAARAISTLLKTQHLGEVNLIYRRAIDSGAEFNLIAVPPDYTPPPVTIGDPVYEKSLYDVGFKLGRNGGQWLKKPPQAGGKA